MKKLLALVLALLMLCSVAFAAELQTINFGDYNMTLDPDMPGDIYEKADSQVYMVLYPNYDDTKVFHSNINAVYMADVEDLTGASQEDIDAYADQVITQAIAGFEAYGAKGSNPVYLGGSLDSQDGVPAISIVYTVDVDYTGAGVDLQTMLYVAQALVCLDGEIGSYVFTVTTESMEELMSCIEILNTLTWNK